MRAGAQPELGSVNHRSSAGWFRAVALDYDGTIAEGGSPGAEVMGALAETRARGIRLILVTGRILSELRCVFPDVFSHVHAVVAENGAILAFPYGTRMLAAPVEPKLTDALLERNVPFRKGQVLLACSADDEAAILDEVHRLGLDCQLLRNRGELMVLPAGVTKGTGLFEALGDLGLSHHNTLGVGDAENDHSLINVCEFGVAVANAIPSLRERADLVLPEANGAGVASLLKGKLLAGQEHVYPLRWQITLGDDEAGQPVRLPASQINVLVAGGTGTGKSYIAGLVAEQLIALRYSLLVIDPEGDHVGLGGLRGVLVVGGMSDLPAADEMVKLVRHRYASVVVDLSMMHRVDHSRYLEGLPAQLEAQRATSGLPQWVIVDEAQTSLGPGGVARPVFEPAAKGHCLVTWRPEDLSADALAGIDAVIALPDDRRDASLVEIAAAVADVPRAVVAQHLATRPARALLAWRHEPGRVVTFTPAKRVTPHRRHEHKYGVLGVPADRRFYVRGEGDRLTGAAPGNLRQLELELGRCDAAALRHHCPGHDFSRWVRQVFYDDRLGEALDLAEATIRPDSPLAVVELGRVMLIAALQGRHRAE